MIEINRFIIKANNRAVTLLKVKEVNNKNDNSYKDLNITFPGRKKMYKPLGTTGRLQELIVNENEESYSNLIDSHISVHCNPGKESITISRKVLYENKLKDSYIQVTPGVKRDKLYIPLMYRICGNMDNSDYQYNYDKSDRIIELPISYNPYTDQLRFMLVVSERGRPFNQILDHPSLLYSATFSNFELTIIYSFFNKKSHKQSINYSFKTTRAQYEYLKGLENWEVYNFYTDCYMLYAEEYFRIYGDE